MTGLRKNVVSLKRRSQVAKVRAGGALNERGPPGEEEEGKGEIRLELFTSHRHFDSSLMLVSALNELTIRVSQPEVKYIMIRSDVRMHKIYSEGSLNM